jgi:hypothetical protein
MGLPVALWAYDITPTESGCTVTESWTDLRRGFFKPIAANATGVSDRAAHNGSTMEKTLANPAAAAARAAHCTFTGTTTLTGRPIIRRQSDRTDCHRPPGSGGPVACHLQRFEGVQRSAIRRSYRREVAL